MNIRLKRANWVFAMALLALPGTLLTSCSKETKTEIVDTKGDKLTISVAGINESEATDPSGAKASVGKSKTKTGTQELFKFSDVDMALSVGSTLPVKKSRSTVMPNTRGGSSSSARAAADMGQGIKYVVYIYDGSTLVVSKELEAGTTGTIEGLDASKSYKWVAVSHNNEDTAPILVPSSASLDIPQDTDLLYATGTLNISSDPNLAITFNHALSRIGIELNTKGVFGEITGNPLLSVSGLSLATGSINLLDGTVTAGATYSPALSYADFQNVDAEYDDAKIAYVYTAGETQQTVGVSLQNLTIVHVDNVGATTNRTYFANPSTFNTSITPEVGKSSHILLNVIESPLVTNYGGNTVRWARSNIYYRGANGSGRDYAFYANNQLSARGDGYFGFGGTIPMKFATAATEGDPCALVYPEGTWRQPTKSEFSGLVRGDIELNSLTEAIGPLGQVVDATGLTGLVNIVTNLLGNSVAMLVNTAAPNSTLGPSPYTYGQYTVSSGAPAIGATNAFGDNTSSSNTLRFFYNGQISNVNVLQAVADGDGLLNVGLNDISADISGIQIANLNLPLLNSFGRATALWTSDQGTNIVAGLVGAGTWGYFGNAGRGISYNTVLGVPVPTGLNARFHMANNTGELLNGVSLVGLDVLGTSFKNVRCVRD